MPVPNCKGTILILMKKNGPFLCLKIKIKLVEIRAWWILRWVLQNQKTCLKTSRYEEENGFFLNSRIRSGNFIHNFNFDFCFAENLSCLSLGRCCGGSWWRRWWPVPVGPPGAWNVKVCRNKRIQQQVSTVTINQLDPNCNMIMLTWIGRILRWRSFKINYL